MKTVTVYQVRFNEDVNVPADTFYVIASGFDDAVKIARTSWFMSDPDRAESAKCDSVRFICKAIIEDAAPTPCHETPA